MPQGRRKLPRERPWAQPEELRAQNVTDSGIITPRGTSNPFAASMTHLMLGTVLKIRPEPQVATTQVTLHTQQSWETVDALWPGPNPAVNPAGVAGPPVLGIHGLYWSPTPGQTCVFGFLQGDVHRPVVLERYAAYADNSELIRQQCVLPLSKKGHNSKDIVLGHYTGSWIALRALSLPGTIDVFSPSTIKATATAGFTLTTPATFSLTATTSTSVTSASVSFTAGVSYSVTSGGTISLTAGASLTASAVAAMTLSAGTAMTLTVGTTLTITTTSLALTASALLSLTAASVTLTVAGPVLPTPAILGTPTSALLSLILSTLDALCGTLAGEAALAANTLVYTGYQTTFQNANTNTIPTLLSTGFLHN